MPTTHAERPTPPPVPPPHDNAAERNRQLKRQLRILRRLATARVAVTVYSLAEDFEVSSRTIRRDLAAIQECGFPLIDVIVDDDTGRIGWRLLESREVSRLTSVEVA